MTFAKFFFQFWTMSNSVMQYLIFSKILTELKTNSHWQPLKTIYDDTELSVLTAGYVESTITSINFFQISIPN